MIRCNCPNPSCKAPMLFRDDAAGKSTKCQACQTACTVPRFEGDRVVLIETTTTESKTTDTGTSLRAPRYRKTFVPTILAGLTFIVGLLLLFDGMTAKSSVKGDIVSIDILATKIIAVVAGGCLLIVGVLFEILAAVKELKIVDLPTN